MNYCKHTLELIIMFFDKFYVETWYERTNVKEDWVFFYKNGSKFHPTFLKWLKEINISLPINKEILTECKLRFL